MNLRATTNRRLLALAVCAVCSAPAGDAAAVEAPNVVLLMADDLGWGDVGFNGSTRGATPHLDEMVRGGMVLTRFYAAAPVCSPTRASCLTGRHPSRMRIRGANDGHLPRAEFTLAELLAERGYTTGMFGKWHLGTLTDQLRDSNRGRPGSRAHYSPPAWHGFEVSTVTEAKVPTFDPMWAPAVRTGKWWDPLAEPTAGVRYGTRYWDAAGEVVTENLRGDDSRVITDRLIPFVRAAAGRQTPFLAVVWFHAPHLPVVAGAGHQARFEGEDGYARNYLGAIAALDEQVGRLRRELRELGIERDTLFWFCSDNGPEGQAASAPGSAGPFRGRKRSLYEGGIRVPAIVEWPAAVAAGRITGEPLVTSDILPTIAEIVGAALPAGLKLDGASARALLDGVAWERPEPIGFHHRGQAAWTGRRMKLYRASEEADWELYDLTIDPGEEHDVAREHPMAVARMREAWGAWRASCLESAGIGLSPARKDQ